MSGSNTEQTGEDGERTGEDESSEQSSDGRRDLGNDMASVGFGDDNSDTGAMFDDEPEMTEPVDTEPDTDSTASTHTQTTEVDTSTTTTNSQDNTDNFNRSIDNPPHRVEKDGPRENREQINVFIDSDDRRKIQNLKAEADQKFDEKVHKIDVYLAALRAGISGNDDAVEERFFRELRKIGYGFWDDI